jgi:hypothetical protein
MFCLAGFATSAVKYLVNSLSAARMYLGKALRGKIPPIMRYYIVRRMTGIPQRRLQNILRPA